MKLILESDQLEDYLKELPPVIQFDGPMVQERLAAIKRAGDTLFLRAQRAFEIARDDIRHSFDTQEPLVTISAEDALKASAGICFAKAHVLATLLRALGIPCGFCYQRVLRKTAPDSGFALHGLNAVYLEEYGWFRVDPRGNKPGIDAQFNPKREQLAYPIRPALGEVDYPKVYTRPLNSVIKAMRESENTAALFYARPKAII